jgi:hypothetical protein
MVLFWNALYRAKKRASTNDKEVDLFNFIDKTPIENLHQSVVL